tara:strand:- start:1585 stop:2103 length:519 start_codon:yes stop_codon:yes gene_type:complete
MSHINRIIEGLIEENPSEVKQAIEDTLMSKLADRLEIAREEIASAILDEKKKEEEDEKEEEKDEDEDEDEEVKEAKKAKQDYDGDGTIETGSQEFMGSRDKAIKKAMSSRKESVGEIDELSTGLLHNARREARRDGTSARDGEAMGEPGAKDHADKRTRLINKIDKRLKNTR